MVNLDQEKVLALKQIHHDLDGDIAKFKTDTHLACVPGCGRCCENPDVEATVLDVLPLAYELWHTGKAEQVFDALTQCGKGRICFFFQADAQVPGHGRCSVYPFRPLICRLFGFSVKNNKHGQTSLVTCPTIKQHLALAYGQTQKQLAAGLKAPSMQEYTMRVMSVDPSLAKEYWPINEAVRRALERVGLMYKKY